MCASPEVALALAEYLSASPSVRAIALVGSYARGQQTPDSDVDLVVLCLQPKQFVEERSWLNSLGKAVDIAVENWGKMDSVRFCLDSREIEVGFSAVQWADVPPDEGTAKVILDGMKILYDPDGILFRLATYLRDSSSTCG